MDALEAEDPDLPEASPEAINAGPPKDKPHIVLFIADDHSVLDAEPDNPDTLVKTPNMKRLAA